MHRHVFIFLMVVLSAAQTYGQFSTPYSSRWQTRLSAGVNLPITKLLKGDVTDDLVGYNNRYAYAQFLTTSVFFKKHWGVDIGIQFDMSSGRNDKRNAFERGMEATYGDAYHVTTSVSWPVGRDITCFYLGAIYRFESERFLIYPMFSIGYTSFDVHAGTVLLKEKNTNTIVQKTYTPRKSSMSPFTLAPSVALGYRWLNRVAVHVDIGGSYFLSDIQYTKATKDLYTQVETTDTFTNQRPVFSLRVGAGVIVTIFERNGRTKKE